MPDTHTDVVEYWNSRAHLGEMAGTNDIIAKQLEMQTLARQIERHEFEPGSLIVDAGCGNGLTLVYLAQRFPQYRFMGIDNSPEMVNAAKAYAESEDLETPIDFQQASVMDWEPNERPDCIYTERTLINLPDSEAQGKAIKHLCSCVKHRGIYMMMENFSEPLERLNALRMQFGLDIIVPPWHNRYMSMRWLYDLIDTMDSELAYWLTVHHYSDEYYYLSRIVNAFAASLEGHEPEYDSDINRVALVKHSPVEFDNGLGQGILYTFRGMVE